ncbi:MAG TPA: NAD(P) transhydrogenase subunit alpha [Alphaproteobacteria bacterium]
MSSTTLANDASDLAVRAAEMAQDMKTLAGNIALQAPSGAGGHSDFLIMGITVFVLACFVGYYVVWRVTPALHSPLMGITNAISSVVIVGAIIAAAPEEGNWFSTFLGFLAIILASVNIFGGFLITRRMLSMFKRKDAKAKA